MYTRREALKALGVTAAAVAVAPLARGRMARAAVGTGAAPAAGGPFTLPALGYAFDALEPFIDAQTMQIHHDRHHAAYVANLNAAVAEAPELAGMSVERMVGDLSKVPEAVRTKVRNNGGGHANHALFWTILKKNENGKPVGELAAAIEKELGGYDECRRKLSAAATGVFGSGWAWLAVKEGKLGILALGNQDSPLSSGHVPVLGIDVWEHAYYLKYQNRRADYVGAFFNVVNWEEANARYRRALG